MENLIQSLKPRLKSLGESLYLLAKNKLSLLAVIILILLVLLAPVPTYNAPLDHVNTFQQRFFTIILDMFNQLASLFS